MVLLTGIAGEPQRHSSSGPAVHSRHCPRRTSHVVLRVRSNSSPPSSPRLPAVRPVGGSAAFRIVSRQNLAKFQKSSKPRKCCKACRRLPKPSARASSSTPIAFARFKPSSNRRLPPSPRSSRNSPNRSSNQTDSCEHQCNDIRGTLNTKRKEIRDFLASSQGLLFTFGTLDRQQQAYSQVLASLEVLAAELAGDIKGHRQRLQKISGGLETASEQTPAGIETAIGKILDATDDMQKRVVAAEQQIANQAETVQMQAILTHTDLLTSLPNRRAFEAEVERASHQGGRTPIATVIFVDLDAFALVNKEYGHQGGDVILRQAAGIVKKLARGRDMVARFSGDTFALLLNQTTLHDALPFAERIRKAFSDAEFSHGVRPLRITASVGIAQLRPEEMRGRTTDRAALALAAAIAGRRQSLLPPRRRRVPPSVVGVPGES